MPELPSATFSADDDGLFSPEEIRQLMEAECRRATRYRYPVTAMSLRVDRLDQLGDLYGVQSREAILRAVTGVIRRNTRESDFLGYLSGATFYAIFPHTEAAVGPALSSRLLADAAGLQFDEGQARLQITLSIGLTHRLAGEEAVLETLRGETTEAVELASSRGGNRCEVYEPPAPAGLPAGVTDPDQLGRQLEQMLAEKTAAFFSSMGEAMPDFGGREQEVLALAMQKMEAAHEEMRREHALQVEKLERRLRRVSDSLEETEDALRRTAQASASGEDTGIASIYRSVQGLSNVENDVGLKKELMSKIFEANLELQNQ